MNHANATPPPAVMQLRSRARVLVVDDDPRFRTILRLALFDGGFRRPREAQDVSSALGILEGSRVDLLLLDWWLGPTSGLELVHAVNASAMNVPIIMLTGETRREQVMEAVTLGVMDYVVKPFRPAELLAKIDNALSCRWRAALTAQ